MPRKSSGGSSTLDKADDAPELTDAFFRDATVRDGDRIVRRGRPKLAAPKQLVSIRFPLETLGRLRATGPGWQGLVVQAVEAALDRRARKPESAKKSAASTSPAIKRKHA